MNLTCPECSTLYRIDPDRVPAEGATAQCRECATVFRVEPDGDQAPGEVRTAPPVAAATGAAESDEPPAEPVMSEEAPGGGEAAAQAPGEAPGEAPTAEAPTEPAPAPSAPAFGPQDPDTRARRLARALVSDIKVYNPEKWEQTRADGTLRKAFRDEILKSWEDYVEQVGEEMAKKTPYFRNALNEILAEGEPVF